ncbi:MAG TPA: 2-hydroxyacid dehydrogenase, partial [Solirubrobacterales bacterium]
VGPLPAPVWQAASQWRLIQLLSAGYDNFEIDRARELRVPVATNGGANAIAVAEHAILLMLAVLRRLVELDREERAGSWRQTQRGEVRYHELCGRRVGLVGMGMIGRQVARRLRGFDVDLSYYDVRRLTPDAELAIGATYLPLDDLLSTVDVLSLHLPLLPETRGIIGARELALLRPDAVIVNTARGELVDEEALVSSLIAGRLGGAGLDVLAQEPPPRDHPLFALSQVVLTPHAAGPTWESWPRRFANGFANVQRVARGEAPLWVIPELQDLLTAP